SRSQVRAWRCRETKISTSFDAPTEPAATVNAVDLVAHLPMALVVVDREGIVRHANLRAEELADAMAPGELEGRRVWDLIERDDVQSVARAFEPRLEIASTVIGPVTLRVRTRRGKSAPVKSWVRLLSDESGFAGYIV